MLRLLQLTEKNVRGVKSVWDELRKIEKVFFGAERTLAFYGNLEIDRDGWIAIDDFVAVCSGRRKNEAWRKKFLSFQSSIKDNGWLLESSDKSEATAKRDGFRLSLKLDESEAGIYSIHMIISHGDIDLYSAAKKYHTTHYHLAYEDEPDWAIYYPIGQKSQPDKAEKVSGLQLVQRLKGKNIIAFLGSGISTASGIRTFTGPGGLEDHFSLMEPFPGKVVKWIIEKPDELMRILGEFQASFVVAEPNDAHYAIAGMEKKGVLTHIITSNTDMLCEKAGCRAVDRPCRFQGQSDAWRWIEEADAMLVVGLSQDEHGLISFARDRGLLIVVIAPELPSFLYPKDLFVQGSAKDVLPTIEKILPQARRPIKSI